MRSQLISVITGSLYRDIFYKGLPTGAVFMLLLFVSANPLLAQRQLLTPATNGKKVAYINYEKVKSQYQAVASQGEKARSEWKQISLALEAEKTALTASFDSAIKEDRLAGGHQVDKLTAEKATKLEQLDQSYKPRFAGVHARNVEALKALDAKLVEVVNQIVSDGGFTAVEALKGTPDSDLGRDISNDIIAKLN